MLPILRLLPVGGVLLAIFILVLALSPPDGSRSSLNTAISPAGGVLLDRDRHPEVRQFLILAALKRANELNRLRDLPDTPTRSEPPPEPPKVAALPSEPNAAEKEDTNSASEAPDVGSPIESSEPPAIDLPMIKQEEPPEAKKPEPAKPQREVRRRVARRAHHKLATNPPPVYPPTLFDILFGGQQYRQQLYNAQSGQQIIVNMYPVPRPAY